MNFYFYFDVTRGEEDCHKSQLRWKWQEVANWLLLLLTSITTYNQLLAFSITAETHALAIAPLVICRVLIFLISENKPGC